MCRFVVEWIPLAKRFHALLQLIRQRGKLLPPSHQRNLSWHAAISTGGKYNFAEAAAKQPSSYYRGGMFPTATITQKAPGTLNSNSPVSVRKAHTHAVAQGGWVDISPLHHTGALALLFCLLTWLPPSTRLCGNSRQCNSFICVCVLLGIQVIKLH